MTWLVAAGWAAGGALVCALIARRPPRTLFRQRHLRENYRGRTVVGTFGILLSAPLALGLGAALWAGLDGTRSAVVLTGAAAAMGLLGLFDDLYASRRAGGFAGHLRALAKGELTTGLLKALGGGVVGLAVTWAAGWRGVWLVVGGMVVALSANLANLLDLRPGRTAKVWLLAWAALLAAGPPAAAAAVSAAVGGGVVALLPAELGERAMLGDTGANLLGTVWGVLAVLSLGPTGLLVALGTLIALTGASEVVSFTRVIERVPPLRALDRLGRTE